MSASKALRIQGIVHRSPFPGLVQAITRKRSCTANCEGRGMAATGQAFRDVELP